MSLSNTIGEQNGDPSTQGARAARHYLSGRFGHGFSETLLTQIGLLALGALTGTAAARLLGPQGRGELAAIILWPSMLVTMVSMGMNQAIVFHTGKRRFGFSEVWTASTVIGLLQ